MIIKIDPDMHNRHSIRLKGFDYSYPGVYFLTLVAHKRECLFGEIEDSQMKLSGTGKLLDECWNRIPIFFPNTNLDEYIIMPNHLHGIIIIEEAHGRGEASVTSNLETTDQYLEDASPQSPIGTRPGSLGAIIQNFKSVSTRKVNRLYFEPGNKIWQRNYYERIIRNDRELNAIRRYIRDNPLNWDLDKENPTNM